MKFSQKKTAFVFPGQGSQKVGMGRAIFANHAEAKQVFEEVDEAVGKKLSEIIFDGPEEELNLTENTQPAIMATSMAVWKVMEKEGYIDNFCSAVAGHSLGEYSALCAAEAIPLATTAKLLSIRGKAMQKAVPVGVGSMAAVMGLNAEKVDEICNDAGCEVANDNSDGQVVVSGEKSTVDKAIELAKAAGAKRAIELQVSAPFHCKLMEPAAEIMQKALDAVTVYQPKVPVIANVTAKPMLDAEDIKKLLVEQVTGTVKWKDTVNYMGTRAGIENIVEIGHGNVLTGLVRRINTQIKTVNVHMPTEIKDYVS